MLTIKANSKNCKLTYVPLNIESIETGETVYDDITITTDNTHNLRGNDTISFIRQDGESISYFEDKEVKNVIDKTAFTIEGFNKYQIDVKGYKPSFVKYNSNIFLNLNGTEDSGIIETTNNTKLYLRRGSQYDIIEITGSTLDSGISENYYNRLVKVEIGTDVTRIEESTFKRCTLLSSVTIPNTVIYIGDYAFNMCSNNKFKKIVIPDSVETIGDYAFNMCNYLIDISIGNGIKHIGKSAFRMIGINAEVFIYAKEPPVLGDSEVFLTKELIGQKYKIPKIYVPYDGFKDYKGEYMEPTNLVSTHAYYKRDYICLNTNEHIFTTNKDDVNVRRRYSFVYDKDDQYGSGEYISEGALTMCDGDYYVFDNIFLIQNNDNTDVVYKNIILDITATTIGYEPVLLTNCLIGVNYDGKDDRYHIYIPYNDGNNIDFTSKIEERIGNTTFTMDDIRFLYNGENQMEFGNEFQPGSYINKVCGNLEVDFGIGDNFEVNLHHDEQITNYIEKVKNEGINKIIDYERYQYTPMYYDGGIPESENGNAISVDDYLKEHSYEIDNNLKEVSKIKFRLYFRTKDFTLYDYEGQIIDKETGNINETDYIDFGTWNTNDNGYWNNYRLRSDHTRLDEVYPNCSLNGDLLGYLGFTDDDVYYQKDALKKSFLRLSFYDSPNRETQKLLYYSTIYFDTNVLSSEYIRDLSIWRSHSYYTPQYNQLVFAYDIVKNFKGYNTSALTAELICTDKYDNTSSSDGFYIHLFNNLVSGNTCTPIYIKAEFNNAKFGKTVPMIRPIFKNSNKPIPPTHASFPREYMKSKTNEFGEIYKWTDMGMLLQDMYIKIFIKYDFNTKKYVWFVPQGQLSDTLTFDLFEPRVKGYDFDSYSTMNGNEVKYGTTNGQPNWYTGEFNTEHVWINGNGQTEEQWANTFNGCVLMTTATTLDGANMLDGTKLFNKSATRDVYRIWIDGMEVTDESVYDAQKGEYKTTNLQLPDIPFTVNIENDGGTFLWQPETTTESWDETTDNWVQDTAKPKKIHRVNYYFKPTNSDVTELFDELYLGTYNKKKAKRLSKTIETTQTLSDTFKNTISNVTTGEKLPNGMFAGIKSLRCVKTVTNNGHSFVTLGNGAFNGCRSLIKVDIEKGTVDIVGKNCFSGCRSLKTAKLTDVKVILKEAFQGCYTLTRTYFTLGDDAKTKYIGCAAFGNTKIRQVSIPSTVIRIADSAYRRCYQLEDFMYGESGKVTWSYFYGPNTYYDESTESMHIGDPDLYTFATESTDYPSQLRYVGKRTFGDCAALKYNLSHNGGGKNKYIYYGGVSNINLSLNGLASVQFHDAKSNKHRTLTISNEKDRGKILYHYKDSNYRKYCDETGAYVYSFGDWIQYVF